MKRIGWACRVDWYHWGIVLSVDFQSWVFYGGLGPVVFHLFRAND